MKGHRLVAAGDPSCTGCTPPTNVTTFAKPVGGAGGGTCRVVGENEEPPELHPSPSRWNILRNISTITVHRIFFLFYFPGQISLTTIT